ncbi:MAG: hypothetical protein JRI68_09005 [Deltaproteobacteria bacterium]|nr:hypothetical protein [Deltaproteobacteria bacterium]
MLKFRCCAVVCLATTALTGCVLDVEEEFAIAVVTSALETPKKQTAGREIAEALSDDCNLSAAEAAAEAAGRPTVGLFPAGCADKVADGADVHVQFAGCTGVFGRVEINGGLDASLEVTGECRLRADIVDSGDLTANGRDLAYEATADIEVLEGARDVAWNAHWIGTTRRGREIEQTSELQVLVDHPTSCLAIDGTAQGHVGEYDYGITIDELAICPEACPAAGFVEAHWEGRWKDRRITVEFDGSNVAHVVGWSGREFEVEMVCGQSEE